MVVAHIERDGTSTPVSRLVDAADSVLNIDLVNFVAFTRD